MRHLLILMAVALAGKVAGQQPGALDSTFAGDGAFEVPASLHTGSRLQLSFVDDVGNVTCASNSEQALRMFRVLQDGTIDTSYYGGYHELTTGQINQQYNLDSSRIRDVQFSNGLLHVRLACLNGVVLLRMNLDFEPDTSFGLGGIAAIALDDFVGQLVQGMLPLHDGGYLLKGRYGPSGGTGSYVMKLDANGDVEAAFGSAGYIICYNPLSFTEVPVMSEFSDGRLAIGEYFPFITGQPAGDGYATMHLYDADGVPLGHTHLECVGAGERFRAMHISRQDELFCSQGEDLGTLWKLDVNGQFSFATHFWGDSDGWISVINSNVDGTILLARGQGWMITRRLPGLAPDVTFGSLNAGPPYWSGIPLAQIPPSATNGFVSQLLPQNDGRLLVLGGVGDQRIIARYHNIPDPRSKLSMRLFLGGAYDSATGLMRDDLRQQGLLPVVQSFDTAQFQPVNGLGSWAMPQHVLAWEGDSAVVDWVWLELLSAADSSTVVATRVGVVHRDGLVTAADGRSPIDFSAGAGIFFIRARHRNHLSVTAAQPLTLGPEPSSLDFTDPATLIFGTDAQMEEGGVHMLWPGDVTGDGLVKYIGMGNDRDAILTAVGGAVLGTVSGYRSEDLNLDGVVKYVGPANDRDVILQVIDPAEPTSVRSAHQP